MQPAKAAGRSRAPWRKGCAVGTMALAAMLAGSAWGAQSRAPFAVTVDLHTAADVGTCLSSPGSPSTASVTTIDCRTQPIGPVPVPAAPSALSGARGYRFMIPTGDGDLRYGGVDLYAGAGTITSWRVVHLTDWEYLEMTVGW
ncbi:MAG TPA: hypothetical protein VLY46_06420 [Usitatibacter sp.]|nr:hypothetical protein [Usitatibacter sp.]